MSTFTAGLIALIIVGSAVYLGFTKDIPFVGHKFKVHAVFNSANSIRGNSPVRIAGVNVGKVVKIAGQEGSDAAVLTLELDKQALPLHVDARAKIRPRIFLEGNFFVDLQPGTPGTPTLDDGDTIKITQTAAPVQLDQVLTALQEDTRDDLRDVLDNLAEALNSEPTAEQDADSDPSARGQTAAESINDSYEDGGPALKATAQVNEALLGVQPKADVQRIIRGLADTTGGLIRNEEQLKDLVTNFNRTMAAFAAEQTNLRTSIRELAPTLDAANRSLTSLNESFPPTRAFARAIIPGVRETPATIDASFPWIAQARRLMSESELRGLARRLSPATRDLAALIDDSLTLIPQIDLLSRCATDVILPTGDVKIQDEFPTNAENYKEFFYTLVGLSGESQNFDGNGPYVRFQPGGGPSMVSLGEASTPTGLLFGNAFPGVGVRPRKPTRVPPYNRDTPCYKSTKPDLNGPWAAKGPFSTNQAVARRSTKIDRGLRQLELRALRSKLRPFGSRSTPATGNKTSGPVGSR